MFIGHSLKLSHIVNNNNNNNNNNNIYLTAIEFSPGGTVTLLLTDEESYGLSEYGSKIRVLSCSIGCELNLLSFSV